MRKTERIIVGLVGPFGSGKTTVAQYLNKKGFKSIKLSGFLEEEAKKKFGKIDRKGLQDIGNEFRKKYGPDILAKWAIEKAQDEKKIVIDGIRNLVEIKFLKKQDDFFLLGIMAESKLRFERLKGKNKGLKTFEDFLRFDARDKGRGQSKSGLQVAKCLEKADFLIENNGSTEKLLLAIDQLKI